MKEYYGKQLERISKAAARKRYEAGKCVYIAACNINPEGIMPAVLLSKQTAENEPFDKMVNYFSAYNCINAETGKYPAFYLKMEG